MDARSVRRLAFAGLLAVAVVVAGSLASPVLAHNIPLDEAMRVPIRPREPGGPLPRALVPRRALRRRVMSLGARFDQCVAEHGGDAPARRLALHILVWPSGEWSLYVGRVPRRPEVGARGATPLEVCVGDWIAGEIGPQLEPASRREGRSPQRTTYVHRVILENQ